MKDSVLENQRIRLSKTMLKDGLLQLLQEKPLQKITISEICDAAQINRTTFYKYYGSQQDLLNEIEADFLNQLENGLKPIAENNKDSLISVLTILYSHRETFKILANAISQKTFAEHIIKLPIINMIFSNLSKQHLFTEHDLPYIRNFIFHGVFAILTDWLCKDEPEPVTEIASILIRLRDKLYGGMEIFNDENNKQIL